MERSVNNEFVAVRNSEFHETDELSLVSAS